jgi:hypothetical protein
MRRGRKQWEADWLIWEGQLIFAHQNRKDTNPLFPLRLSLARLQQPMGIRRTSFIRSSMSMVPAEEERRTIVGSKSLQNSSMLTMPDLSSSRESAHTDVRARLLA